MRFPVLASLGQRFVLLWSRLPWVPPHRLCSSAFVSWLLCDSLCFFRDPASRIRLPYCVLYCPDFSGTAFSSVRVPASLGPSPTLVCFCFSVPASLGQFFAGPGPSGPFPYFLEMHGLGDFDAPLDSVALI